MKKVVVIGGGTGTTSVLLGLKQNKDIDLSVIVSMTDDGGSNAVIQDEFGLLPLGDLRKSILALADVGTENQVLQKMFAYRFDKGNGLSGHTLGSLIMIALSDIAGSEVGAINAVSELFHARGHVIPVTLEHACLVADYDTGKQVKGEHLIDEPPLTENTGRIIRLGITPQVQAYDPALRALSEADYIIAGPGDLYTTTLANIIVGGVAHALQMSKAKFIFINNLMSKRGQTNGFKASDLVAEITKYAGRKPDVVVQHEGALAEEVLEKYRERGEERIEDDLVQTGECMIVRTDIAFEREVAADKGDTLARSLIRHDGVKLAQVLVDIMK
jgi:uncharacterized cofD-like protein